MSKNCRIEFVDGELVCLCQHHNYDNCDLVKAEKRLDMADKNPTIQGYFDGVFWNEIH